MASGDLIRATDYNSIRSKAYSVLGTGSGTNGYGQIISSPYKSAGNTVAASEWNALRNDILNIKLHQTGSQPSLASPSTGDIVDYDSTEPNNQYDTMVSGTVATKFNIASSRSVVTSKLSKSRTGAWSVKSYCTATITFSSANTARYFFNAGGKLRSTSSRTGGTSKDQNTAWSNLLSSSGIVELGAATSSLKTIYQLTNSYQTIHSHVDSGAYTSNEYRISAKCNVTNNSTATATTFYLYFEWIDGYTDDYPNHAPYDSVDGTLSVAVEELKATGSMLPSGTFTIVSPTYSITDISAS